MRFWSKCYIHGHVHTYILFHVGSSIYTSNFLRFVDVWYVLSFICRSQQMFLNSSTVLWPHAVSSFLPLLFHPPVQHYRWSSWYFTVDYWIFHLVTSFQVLTDENFSITLPVVLTIPHGPVVLLWSLIAALFFTAHSLLNSWPSSPSSIALRRHF